MIVGLSNETATLAIDGREHVFPISEVARVWDGSFIIVWKPPFASRQFAPGAQGEDVAWIRQSLDVLEKKSPAAEVSDLSVQRDCRVSRFASLYG